MLFDGWDGVTRVPQVGALAYLALVVLLRTSGKRTLAKMNAFDLVITVAFGSTLASILLSSDIALVEGVTALALLVAAQWVVAKASTRWRLAQRLVKSEPRAVFVGGDFDWEAMARERLTAEEVRQAIRGSGTADLSRVAVVVLETDGTFAVIAADRVGDGGALVDTSLVSHRTRDAGPAPGRG